MRRLLWFRSAQHCGASVVSQKWVLVGKPNAYPDKIHFLHLGYLFLCNLRHVGVPHLLEALQELYKLVALLEFSQETASVMKPLR